jgi:hypothetical protein
MMRETSAEPPASPPPVPPSEAAVETPAFVSVDKTLEKAVAEATRLYLEAFAETSVEVGNEEGMHGALPFLNSEGLGCYLSESLALREDAHPWQKAYLNCLIGRASLALIQAQLEIDGAIEDALKGKALISASSMYVNDPAVFASLELYTPPPLEVMLVPISSYYKVPPIAGDHRRDLIVGALRWNNIYLCRPALVSLVDIQEELADADKFGPIFVGANVTYQPRYGTH